MNSDYYLKISRISDTLGFEYSKQRQDMSADMSCLYSESVHQFLKKSDLLDWYLKELPIDHERFTILEFDNLDNNEYRCPAIFTRFNRENESQILNTFFALSNQSQKKLPTLNESLCYNHIGCFVDRENSPIRFTMVGTPTELIRFAESYGYSGEWIRIISEHHDLIGMIAFDFYDNLVQNLKLEIYDNFPPKCSLVKQIHTDSWLINTYNHAEEKILDYYKDDLPKMINLNHVKVSLDHNEEDYLKMYIKCQF